MESFPRPLILSGSKGQVLFSVIVAHLDLFLNFMWMKEQKTVLLGFDLLSDGLLGLLDLFWISKVIMTYGA